VIVEYKRHSNENVINQGLFYLDWLLDHQAEFRWLVMEKLGKDVADDIDWAGTRLLCIAADFTRYDQHAVQQIPRNIELLRYKLFDNDLLLLELVNAVSVPDVTVTKPETEKSVPKSGGKDKSLDEQYAGAMPETRAVYDALVAHTLALGDDVVERRLKLYTAFRRLKNFVSLVMYPNKILVMLKVDPETVVLEDGFSRDVRHIGHWGTGDLELTVRTEIDVEKAKPLVERSYQES
jgi:predicted transport protein